MNQLERRQIGPLNDLLQKLLSSNRFYGAKLRRAGVSLPVADMESFRREMPFTDKRELIEDQQTHPPFGTNLTHALTEYVRYHQTSGTSGEPLRRLDTPSDWQWMVGNWKKVLEAAGIGVGDRVLFAFSFGPFLGFWTAFDAAQAMGCLCLPAGGMSTLARLRMIRENGVSAVCCTPTYALRMGEEAAAHPGIDLSSVRSLIVAGEPGGGVAEVRGRIKALWGGAAVMDHHGMTELGPVSYGMPDHPGVLRIIETAFISEIVDPESGQAVEPGTPGELVLTSLGRVGAPLIRYRTGDLVKAWPQAPDALRPYHLEGGILGRIDDMVLVRGVNLYPSAVEAIVRGFPQIAEFRVKIATSREMTEIEIEIEPHASCAETDPLKEDLETELRSAFALRIPVSTVAPGTLPRFEMKAKRWVRHHS